MQEAEQQSAINLAEASNPSIFAEGGRPACAWTCAFGFFCSFVLAPLLAWSSSIVGIALGFVLPVPPTLDTGSLMTLLGGMLGLGTLRAVEKVNGVGAANLSSPLPGTPGVPRRR